MICDRYRRMLSRKHARKNKINQNRSLQVKHSQSFQKVSSYIWKKGSLTVESAVAIPLFFLSMVTLLCLMDLFRIQTIVSASLCESAKELGMYAYTAEHMPENSPIRECSSAACMAYGKAKLARKLKGESVLGVRGGIPGISLLTSSYENQIIDLKATYRYRFPIAILPLPTITLHNRGRVRAWTGYQGTENSNDVKPEEEMVYVTEHESVYHESGACTHLDLSISYVSQTEAKALRNEYGEKYHACEKCGKHAAGTDKVYITGKGNRYHDNGGCSGLKRSVKLVKKSSVGDLHVCIRCQKEKSGSNGNNENQ